MAALDDDNIVGTDHPAKPLSRRVLDVFVAEPHVMGLFVKAQFKLRTSNKKLDDDTVEKLCSKASHTLRISECSQHEPTLGVASAIMPLTACWCVPARPRVARRCGAFVAILLGHPTTPAAVQAGVRWLCRGSCLVASQPGC